MGAMKGVATMTLWGFLLLIVLPLVLVLILILVGSALDRQDRKRRGEEDYDERQQYYRGRAYGYAFWTLAGCMLAWGVLDVFADWPWLHDVWNVAGGCLCLAVLVFVLYCGHQIFKACGLVALALKGCLLLVLKYALLGELARGPVVLGLLKMISGLGRTRPTHHNNRRRRRSLLYLGTLVVEHGANLAPIMPTYYHVSGL